MRCLRPCTPPVRLFSVYSLLRVQPSSRHARASSAQHSARIMEQGCAAPHRQSSTARAAASQVWLETFAVPHRSADGAGTVGAGCSSAAAHFGAARSRQPQLGACLRALWLWGFVCGRGGRRSLRRSRHGFGKKIDRY
eukprot:scaffold6249_cov124-Isochrysis_galbana.AAC.9